MIQTNKTRLVTLTEVVTQTNGEFKQTPVLVNIESIVLVVRRELTGGGVHIIGSGPPPFITAISLTTGRVLHVAQELEEVLAAVEELQAETSAALKAAA